MFKPSFGCMAEKGRNFSCSKFFPREQMKVEKASLPKSGLLTNQQYSIIDLKINCLRRVG
ncbi:hypothetical protein PEDI_29120 [Persicobacter diffluens]|uniref:Uncharacterized protein n=1 Tax=Persicobacter diffluens TaxID=981 RepID=A0AAN4W1U3_9BACT|nr:hypothetical protein PEDI_29120 [Persicobacter diffluens]